MTRVAVLGAGHVGPVIARIAVAAGYQVTIAASGDPERIALIIGVLAPGVEPQWAADAVAGSDVVVLADPEEVDPDLVGEDAVLNEVPDRLRV